MRSSSIRPNLDTGGSKFGRHFDQTSTPPVSKFGRSLVSQFGRHFIKFTMYFIDISSKLRPNFDTGGVEVWSKFARSFDTWGVEVCSKFRPNFDTHIVQTIRFYLTYYIMFPNNKLVFQQPFKHIVCLLENNSSCLLDKTVCLIYSCLSKKKCSEGLSKQLVYVFWTNSIVV